MVEHDPGMVSFVRCDGRAFELRGWFSWSLRLFYFPVCQQPDVSPSCDNTFGHAAVSVSASYLVLVISHVVRNDADMFDTGGFSLIPVAHVKSDKFILANFYLIHQSQLCGVRISGGCRGGGGWGARVRVLMGSAVGPSGRSSLVIELARVACDTLMS